MTASLHPLKSGRDAGLYYVNDPNREARPRNRDEYYLADGSGVWWSSGETIVRHGAVIDKASFRDLCAGVDPRTGRSLVRGAGESHRAGWDVTFSAPKSLSLLWAAGTDEQRAAIEAMHGQAVDAALRFVKRQQLLEVRLGAGGKEREQPTDIIVGRFRHTTSRAGDPNLHTHCVLMNVAGCVDGRWRTLEPDAMFKWTLTLGAAYRAELSALTVAQGFAPRPAGRDQFEIRGIDAALIEVFSKRSRMIEAVVGDRDTVSGARKEIAALATRQSKETLPTGAELEARWQTEFGIERERIWAYAFEAGREPIRAAERDAHRLSDERDDDETAIRREGPSLDPIPVVGHDPVARAASELLSRQSVVNRREMLRHAFVVASHSGIDIAAVESELVARQTDRSLLMLQDGRNAAWTTEHLLEREAAMRVACHRADERGFFLPDTLEAALETAPHLSDEQQAAVRSVVGRDGVSVIEAGAGTGKTTLASAIKVAADRSGLRTVGLAPTWLAADELAKSTGIPAQAVAKWRYDREIGSKGADGIAGRDMSKLDSRTLLLLDEAGMLGTLDMAAVLTAAKAAGAKVVAFGDRRQLQAVASGSALAAVAEELRRVETLATIRRQRQGWQRTASLAMSEGQFDAALAAYHAHGAIRFADGTDAAIAEAIRQWRELRFAYGESVAIVTRSNRDAALLNAAARCALREEGQITTTETLVSAIDRKNKTVSLALAAGDHLRFGANLPDFDIRNGTRGRVLSIDDSRGDGNPVVRVALENGREIAAAWPEFAPPQRGRVPRPLPRVTHAYAGTVYSVQGRTAEAAVVHIGSRTDARTTYVAMTRHRSEVRMVVDVDRLLKETSLDIAATGADDPVKLAALVAEAAHFEEKPNIGDFTPLVSRSPDHIKAPNREAGPSLTF